MIAQLFYHRFDRRFSSFARRSFFEQLKDPVADFRDTSSRSIHRHGCPLRWGRCAYRVPRDDSALSSFGRVWTQWPSATIITPSPGPLCMGGRRAAFKTAKRIRNGLITVIAGRPQPSSSISSDASANLLHFPQQNSGGSVPDNWSDPTGTAKSFDDRRRLRFTTCHGRVNGAWWFTGRRAPWSRPREKSPKIPLWPQCLGLSKITKIETKELIKMQQKN